MPTQLLSLIAAVVVNIVLGFAWYSKSMFGKPWMKMTGFTEKSMDQSKKGMEKTYALMTLGTILQVLILNMFINRMPGMSPVTAAKLGFMLWLGFIFVTQLTGEIFSGKGFKPTLLAINAGYQLVAMLAMSAILAKW